MKDLAIRQGVNPDDIYLDQEGTRTMETCLRARDNYNLDHVILVSQEFHLPRALSICKAIGIDAIGVRADLRSYGHISPRFWQLREIPATFVAVWESLLLSVNDKGS
jgi:vancomycin permeability regulator SanA